MSTVISHTQVTSPVSLSSNVTLPLKKSGLNVSPVNASRAPCLSAMLPWVIAINVALCWC